ncbi:hypothetical protein Tco_1507774 [Tanacetum coccineum]
MLKHSPPFLANKIQEAVDLAIQLRYDRIREESHTENQQFLDSIDEGMKKVIKEQVKKEVSKITPKIEKLVNEQLESEVLMEANILSTGSRHSRQLYKALVDAYEADKILLDTYGDTVTIKRPRDGADDDQEPSAGTDRGSKRRRSGKEPASTSAPRETTTTTAGKTTTGSKTHKQSASQSAPVEETMQSTDVFKAPAHQEFETGVHDEQAEEEVHHLPDWFQQPKRLPSPDHAWNNLTELEYFCEEVYKATTEKLDWINPEGRQYPHDLQKPLPLVPNSQGRHLRKTKATDYGHIKWIEDLVPNSMWSQVIVNYDKFALWGISHWGKKRRQFYAFAITRESARDVYSKRRINRCHEGGNSRMSKLQASDWITVLGMDTFFTSSKKEIFTDFVSKTRRQLLLLVQKVDKSSTILVIYENKNKKNRLMRIEELHKFSDGTLNDVRTALNDRLKGIRMEYLPQTFWSQQDKVNARAMIQAIDKRLKTRSLLNHYLDFGWISELILLNVVTILLVEHWEHSSRADIFIFEGLIT